MHENHENETEIRTNTEEFFVVGIGASAGGLEALERFFESTPVDSDMAFVVVQHLSPDFKSVMDQLLTRRTKIPVELIVDGTEVQPNRIYLLPPKKEAILSQGRLLLADRAENGQLTFPIDHFLRSLAQDAGRRAIAVILSGTGSDGSRGVLDIHGLGGLVVAQSESSAKFDGMPRSATDTGVVDMVLPVHEIPRALVTYRNKQMENAFSRITDDPNDIETPLKTIFSRLRECYGIDFADYKRTTIGRRIERRLILSGTMGLAEYVNRLHADNGELDRLYRDLLIGVTGFFRDKEVFKRLELDVIPALIARLAPGEEVRVWVVACATGEEAYSLAILLREFMDHIDDHRPVRVFASDVHKRSLQFASRAVYQQESLAGMTAERLDRHFIARDDGYYVSPEIRKMVVFTPHNVLRDAPFTKLDLITCRNMMIYLTQPAQQRVLSLFHFGLKRDGILCLGASESTGDLADEFEPVDEKARIYRKHRDLKRGAAIKLATPGPLTGLQNLPEPAVYKNQNSSRKLLGIYDRLLEQYMPPGILVSTNRELLHCFGGAGQFLRQRDGRPTRDISEMVLPDLRSPLTSAIRRVVEEQKSVRCIGIHCETESGPQDLAITVFPLEDADGESNFMIQFDIGVQGDALAESPSVISNDLMLEDYQAIERELQHTKDNLQSTIEELQTTNEELQSSNEQLTSSNEELQSTNEELHSVNEELYTVNAEHQRKIDELTELYDDMDNLLNSTNVHTLFLDRDLCIRRFTPGLAETFSLIPQDVGRRFDSFSHKILFAGLTSEVQRVLNTGQPFEKEVSDQHDTWYFLRIQPYISRRKVDGVVITLVDVTTLKNAQALLQEMSEIVEHSDDAIYRIDLEGKIKTWNLGARRLYGYESSEAIGKHVSLLAPEDRRDEPEAYLERISSGVTVDYTETARLRRNGTTVEVSLTVSPIANHQGEIVGASVIARDITNQKQAEAEIREAVRHRDQFLATLSHELRNPLSAILNATALLREDSIDEAILQEAREVVDHQLRHVARLLDDLLDVARFTNGKLILRKEVVDLTALANNVVECVQFQIDAKGQQLRMDIHDEPLLVEGDVGRLQQAQVNLLVNASKYSPNGGAISYGIGRDGDEAVVTVRDEGEGIPASLLPSIFDPFVQAEQSIERAQGGMGLGLPLVKMIANAHNGVATAHSGGPGRGSEFALRFPITSKRLVRKGESVPAETAGKKLLIIEDNDGIRKMLSRSMKLKGFVVEAVGNGRDGIESIKSFQPDISVVDIGLPDINGYELARDIRSDEQFKESVLFAVTGYGRAEDRQKAVEAGFDLHLVKPIDPDELMQTISDFESQKVQYQRGQNESLGAIGKSDDDGSWIPLQQRSARDAEVDPPRA